MHSIMNRFLLVLMCILLMSSRGLFIQLNSIPIALDEEVKILLKKDLPKVISYQDKEYNFYASAYRNFHPVISPPEQDMLRVSASLMSQEPRQIAEQFKLKKLWVINGEKMWKPNPVGFGAEYGPRWDIDIYLTVIAQFQTPDNQLITLKSDKVWLQGVN